jgi:hypothetical protein
MLLIPLQPTWANTDGSIGCRMSTLQKCCHTYLNMSTKQPGLCRGDCIQSRRVLKQVLNLVILMD